MKKITLRKTNTGWMATFHGDAEMLELFGTDTIPTAFTAQAPAGMVLKEIAALNPGYEIEIAH